MSHPVIDKTKLKCNKGTTETLIQVTSQNFTRIAGELIATEADKQSNTNIVPFGKCKLKPTMRGYLPCTSSLIQWQNTSCFTADQKRKLTTDSFCICSIGGKITPIINENSGFHGLE